MTETQRQTFFRQSIGANYRQDTLTITHKYDKN